MTRRWNGGAKTTPTTTTLATRTTDGRMDVRSVCRKSKRPQEGEAAAARCRPQCERDGGNETSLKPSRRRRRRENGELRPTTRPRTQSSRRAALGSVMEEAALTATARPRSSGEKREPRGGTNRVVRRSFDAAFFQLVHLVGRTDCRTVSRTDGRTDGASAVVVAVAAAGAFSLGSRRWLTANTLWRRTRDPKIFPPARPVRRGSDGRANGRTNGRTYKIASHY